MAPDDPRLQGWYHTIELGDGLVSDAVFDHRPVIDCYGLPESLEGKTCLDIGTGDGFFAFEMERRGAERVVAIDVPRLGDCDWLPRMRSRLGPLTDNQSWPSHFRLAHELRESSVEYKFCSIYELSPWAVGMFDVVFCGSLLLHLQQPLQALINIRSVTSEIAVVETAVDPVLERESADRPLMSFGCPHIEDETGERNVFWQFTTAALRRMMQYADFAETTARPLFELPPGGIHSTSVVGYAHPRGV